MKDERSKTIALVAAIVVVFTCGAMRLRGASTSSVAPKVDTSLVTEPAPTTDPNAKPTTPDDVVVQRAFPTPSEEPFRSYEPKGGLPKVVEKAPPAMTGNIGGPLPAVGGPQPMNPIGNAATSTSPVLHLSGVMPGRNGVAVIEFGNESHVVRVGEQFGAGYTLQSIGRQSVKIRSAGKNLELSLDD